VTSTNDRPVALFEGDVTCTTCGVVIGHVEFASTQPIHLSTLVRRVTGINCLECYKQLGVYSAWTGSLGLFHELRDNVRRALDWIDHFGDSDGDGFVDYQTHSSAGGRNQGWKDSGNGIVMEDGQLAEPPIALPEDQGEVYLAWTGMAELFERDGDRATAQRLREQAQRLHAAFNRRFWLPDQRYYAFCRQADGRFSKSVASNPAHALWTGIVDPKHARAVGRRVLEADMFSGWGIRTFSSKDACYNPVDYQLGSVWPHDYALIVAGMQRYGFGHEANEVFTAMMQAASASTAWSTGVSCRPAARPRSSAASPTLAATRCGPTSAPAPPPPPPTPRRRWTVDLWEANDRRAGTPSARVVAYHAACGEAPRRDEPAAQGKESVMQLSGKTALVTGSSSGIGRAIALAFGHEGADVAVHYHRDQAGADEVAQQLKALGRRAPAFGADAAVPTEMQTLVEQSVQALGRLDILVCSAGLEIREPFLDVTEEHYNLVLDVNLKGSYFAAQAAARQMVKQGHGGRLINISSIHEDAAFLNYSTYCLSKGGLRMFARTACQELAPHGITVNNIAPGAVETPINTRTLESSQLLDELKALIPLGRLATPEEVASVAVYLASDAAAYVTGSTYYIDGGMTRWNKGL
jgi:glucose 1-dehydrogenase